MAYDRDSVDHVLTTTRSVRRRLDFNRPIEPEVLEECVEIAIQAAPGGGEVRPAHFFIVTDELRKDAIAGYYREALFGFRGQSDAGSSRAMRPTIGYLAENLHRCPALVIPCLEGRVENEPQPAQATFYSQILPAAWSFMMALRTRGLGTAWTGLHLRHADEIGELLAIPKDVTQVTLFPVAYFTGDDNFKRAERAPVAEMMHWDVWGNRRED